MAQVTLKGNPINTAGELPAVGSDAPNFSLTKNDLSETTLKDYEGKNVILNIFPSLDTSTCAASVRRFNEDASKVENTVVLCVSKDLPFAHSRFCETEGIENVVNGSEFRDSAFSDNYHVMFTDGPLAGLFSRSIVVINPAGKVTHTEQVGEIVDEPDYEKALAAIE